MEKREMSTGAQMVMKMIEAQEAEAAKGLDEALKEADGKDVNPLAAIMLRAMFQQNR